MELSAASFSYPQHDTEIRAEIARRVLTGEPVQRGFVLSTCLRVELVVSGPERRLRDTLTSLLGDPPIDVAPIIRSGRPAVTHLYRIAAGLESPILGEQEILTQFRQSLLEAESNGQVGGLLARLLESAVSAGRRARELLPPSPHNSMAAVAAQAVGTADRVAVFGSGIMATAVLEGLMLLPAPPHVTVVARNPDKVAKQPGVEVLEFKHASRVIEEFPAVVSATSAKHRLIDDQSLADAIARRRTPLQLIDMAMPPDFRPSLDKAISYLAIDDLARMADRRLRSDQADAFVESASVDAYRQYREHHEVGPLIGGLMAKADAIVDDAVRRFSGRLGDPSDEAVLRQSTHTVARTLLAGPVSYLRTGEKSSEALDVIAEAFDVTDD